MPVTSKKMPSVKTKLKPKTKVASKKTVVKKTAAKSSAVKAKSATAPAPLVVADDVHSFWVSDGQILNSLKALELALAKMEPEIFSHHVDKTKHDFSLWVEVVLKDKSCALDIAKTKTPKTALTVVRKHLKRYAK